MMTDYDKLQIRLLKASQVAERKGQPRLATSLRELALSMARSVGGEIGFVEAVI